MWNFRVKYTYNLKQRHTNSKPITFVLNEKKINQMDRIAFDQIF